MSAGASARVSRSARQADESGAVSPDSAASADPHPLPQSGEPPRPVRLPAGLSAVLGVLSSSAVVIDSNDRVLQASEAARAFGLVKDNDLVVGELLALARQVRRDGEIREGEIDISTERLQRPDHELRRAGGPARAQGSAAAG